MKRHGRRIGVLVGTAVFVVAVLPGIAFAHLQAANAVDTSTNPPEIRWQDQTRYDGARQWSIDRWNPLNPVNILADNSSTVADLEFMDDASDNGYCGIYIPNFGADNIKYYIPSFTKLTTGKREACATHELGHALSLAHNSDGTKDQVMDPCPVCSNPSWTRYPQDHDKYDYHYKWGY